MIWSTAGTNRVCSRCLALKDTVVGYTYESGVTLPPLHPRCRCTIIYDEIGTPRAEQLPKPNTIDSLTLPTTSGNVGREVKPLTPKQIKEIRDAEDKAFYAKTGADFGFKKLVSPSDWSREILLTNPPNELYGHTPNCQRCVVAHEARMRGYDVIARPSWGAGDTLRSTGEQLKSFDYQYNNFKECVGKTGKEVLASAKEIMQSFGKGSRAIIVFKWNESLVGRTDGHTIVAQCRENGIVNFGDPQWGERSIAYKLNFADYKAKIVLLRVDNLKFTNVVKRCCMNKE